MQLVFDLKGLFILDANMYNVILVYHLHGK